MPQPQYLWRQLTPEQRAELLAWRQAHGRPWHSPPHRPNFGHRCFHITAACYEHRPYIGHSPARMDTFACDLLTVLGSHATRTFAWCVLPNHYHSLVEAPDVLDLLRELAPEILGLGHSEVYFSRSEFSFGVPPSGGLPNDLPQTA